VAEARRKLGLSLVFDRAQQLAGASLLEHRPSETRVSTSFDRARSKDRVVDLRLRRARQGPLQRGVRPAECLLKQPPTTLSAAIGQKGGRASKLDQARVIRIRISPPE